MNEATPHEVVWVTTARMWWLHPVAISGIIVFVSIYAAASGGRSEYAVWRTPKFLTESHITLMSLGYAAFAIGILITYWSSTLMSRRAYQQSHRSANLYVTCRRVRACDAFASSAFYISLLGYTIWAAIAISRGAGLEQIAQIVSLESGAVSELRRLSTPVGGLTTIAQAAPVSAAIRTFLLRIGARERRWQLLIIIAMSTARALFYGERLALIEVLIAIIVICALVPLNGVRSKPTRIVWALAPIISVPLLWITFAAFEYSRSWLYYREITDLTYVQYINQRLLGYYVTSVNNGALYHTLLSDLPHASYFTFSALWNAPIVGSAMGTPLIKGSYATDWWQVTLRYAANEEFNNPSTFLVVDADLGTFGAIVYWFTFGLFIGLLFAGIKRGSLGAMIIYACSFVGILEITRVLYWAEGRYTPIVLIASLFAIFIRRYRFPIPQQSSPQQGAQHTNRFSFASPSNELGIHKSLHTHSPDHKVQRTLF